MSGMKIIGIDPALRQNGFAVCTIDIDCNCMYFNITDFIDFIIDLDNKNPSEYIFAVENSNLQNLTFDMRGNKNVIARKSRNVGMNQAVSQLTCEFLKRKGYKVLELSPAQKGKKWSVEDFDDIVKTKKYASILNYKGLKTEQDKRDAYKIALLCQNILKIN
jgi:hypothetical protein